MPRLSRKTPTPVKHPLAAVRLRFDKRSQTVAPHIMAAGAHMEPGGVWPRAAREPKMGTAAARRIALRDGMFLLLTMDTHS